MAAVPPPAGEPAAPVPAEGLPDVSPQADAFGELLATLLGTWTAVAAAQKLDIVAQIRRLVDAGRRPTASDLQVDTDAAQAVLLPALVEAAGTAARLVTGEAHAQHAVVDPVQPPAAAFVATGSDVTGELADQMTSTAVTAVAGLPLDATADEAATAAQEALDGLSDGAERTHLGGALHGAMNTARTATLRSGPVGAVYASEKNDANTCDPCHEIDGRWLGNTGDLAQVEASYPGGAYGGYIGCLGGIRCRGTITGVWREGHDSVNEPRSPLAGHIKSGEASTTVLGGGMSARTELVTFNDGSQAIRKTVADDMLRDRVETNDAEELAAMLAERLGIDAPEVRRNGKDSVWMEYVDGAQTGMERYGWNGPASTDVAELAATDAGRRLGLFDIAIGNMDRNGGNWLVTDSGGLVAIDHGAAFARPVGSFTIDDVLSSVTGPNNVFAHALAESGNYSRADVEQVRQVLLGMLPTFQRLGRLSWYNDSRVRLAGLDEHASGSGAMW